MSWIGHNYNGFTIHAFREYFAIVICLVNHCYITYVLILDVWHTIPNPEISVEKDNQSDEELNNDIYRMLSSQNRQSKNGNRVGQTLSQARTDGGDGRDL